MYEEGTADLSGELSERGDQLNNGGSAKLTLGLKINCNETTRKAHQGEHQQLSIRDTLSVSTALSHTQTSRKKMLESPVIE